MKNKIIIFGSGGHCKVVIDILERNREYEICGLIDSENKIGQDFCGYKIIGSDNDINLLIKKYSIKGGIVAVGDNDARAQIVKNITKQIPNFNFINAIHNSAIIAKSATMGFGNVFAAGAIINPYSEVKNHCIVNTHSSIDHDSVMCDFASIAPGANCGGNVKIGEGSFIGIGASVIHKIKIGNFSVVGAGSVVVSDIEDRTIYLGVPARKVKKREIGQKYL